MAPTVTGPKVSGSVINSPRNVITRPGRKRKNSAPWTNIARMLIHAAAKGDSHPDRLWWDSRPSRSLRNVTGTSVVLSSIRTDFNTISEAYSHDWEIRP